MPAALPALSTRPAPWVRTDSIALLTVTLSALAARIIYLLQVRANPLADKIIMDARSYWEWSDRLVKGDWLGDQIFYQAPLYPYFLGLLKSLFGADLWTVKIVQAILGAVACGLLLLASRLWFSAAGMDARRVRALALAAGFVLALYPPAIFLDSLIQKANLGVLWMTLLLWQQARVWLRPTGPRAIALGLVMALLILTREETLLLAPVVAAITLVAALRRREAPGAASGALRPMAVAALGLVAGASIVLSPVAWRNHRVGGEWVLTTSQAGPNFYIGNNPSATGIYAPLRAGRSNTPFERRDAFELAAEALGRQPTPTEVSRYWMRRSFDFITAEPLRWLRLLGRKSVLLINSYEVPDSEDQYYFERDSLLLRGLGLIGHMGILAPLAAAGLVLARLWFRELWPLYLMLAALAAAVVLFYVFARYRFPIVPVMIPMAVLGVSETIARIRERRIASLALPAMAAALMAVPANWPMFDRRHELAATVSNAGAAISESGDDPRAIALFQQALAINPQLPDTLSNLATSQFRTGQAAAAEKTLRDALAMRPDDARLNFRLGTLLAETNRLPDCVPYLQKALQRSPQDADTRANLIAALSALGRTGELIPLLRETVKREPSDLSAAANLAWLLATTRDDRLRSGVESLTIVRDLIARAPVPSADLNDILAAALAETGDFAGAVAAEQAALDLGNKSDSGLSPEALAGFASRMNLYKTGKPFREP